MIKDREQKRMAAKFCASQGLVPFLEVIVRSRTGLEDSPTNITDVDVLGLDIQPFSKPQRIIFDCKTGSRMSAINRALWARGLADFIAADKAYVLQKREIPYSHKVAAIDVSVFIHSEETFSNYAASFSNGYLKDITYLDDLDIWDRLLAVHQKFPAVEELSWFVCTEVALESSGPKGLRSSLATLKKVAPELDPTKGDHRLLFGVFLSSFLVFLALTVNSLREIFQFTMPRDDFEKVMRYFVWEGRENYINRQQMRIALEKVKGSGDPGSVSFELPEWDRFLHVVRLLLDAPDALRQVPFIAKELAFRSACAEVRMESDDHIRALLASNKRARQFIYLTANYLVHCARLPKEFAYLVEYETNILVSG